MGTAVMKRLRFADSQESCFQDSRRSNMGSAVLVGGRSPDIQEFCFEASKLSDMDCVEVQERLFADRMAFSAWETFREEQYFPARVSIC